LLAPAEDVECPIDWQWHTAEMHRVTNSIYNIYITCSETSVVTRPPPCEIWFNSTRSVSWESSRQALEGGCCVRSQVISRRVRYGADTIDRWDSRLSSSWQ